MPFNSFFCIDWLVKLKANPLFSSEELSKSRYSHMRFDPQEHYTPHEDKSIRQTESLDFICDQYAQCNWKLLSRKIEIANSREKKDGDIEFLLVKWHHP